MSLFHEFLWEIRSPSGALVGELEARVSLDIHTSGTPAFRGEISMGEIECSVLGSRGLNGELQWAGMRGSEGYEQIRKWLLTDKEQRKAIETIANEEFRGAWLPRPDAPRQAAE